MLVSSGRSSCVSLPDTGRKRSACRAVYHEEITRVLAPGGTAVVHYFDGCNVVCCHLVTAGVHRYRAAYSQRWRLSEDCKSSVSGFHGGRLDDTISVAIGMRSPCATIEDCRADAVPNSGRADSRGLSPSRVSAHSTWFLPVGVRAWDYRQLTPLQAVHLQRFFA
jgi:hypothetical protein